MKGSEIIGSLKRRLRVPTDKALADRLGVTVQSIQNWKNRRAVTPRQVAGLIHSACGAATASFQATAIRPLVEFFPVSKCESRGGARYELFRAKSDDKTKHP